jgi:hypothetical protein
MNKDQILSRLAEIKAEERELKALLKKLEGNEKPTRKRQEVAVSEDNPFMRMANKIVNSKRWEA